MEEAGFSVWLDHRQSLDQKSLTPTRPDHRKPPDKTIVTHQTRPPEIDPPRTSSLFEDGGKRLERKRKMKKERKKKEKVARGRDGIGGKMKEND
jgi:hypothetical protein